jgi:hypothetical protein
MKLQILKSRRGMPLVATLAATLLVSSAAHADVESGKLTLSGYIDAAVGEQLMAGNYDAVINKLAPHMSDFTSDEVAASTNLCVAYVATGKLAQAHQVCDQAITMARLEQPAATLLERLAHRDALSVAYANRAVLAKLSGE